MFIDKTFLGIIKSRYVAKTNMKPLELSLQIDLCPPSSSLLGRLCRSLQSVNGLLDIVSTLQRSSGYLGICPWRICRYITGRSPQFCTGDAKDTKACTISWDRGSFCQNRQLSSWVTVQKGDHKLEMEAPKRCIKWHSKCGENILEFSSTFLSKNMK